MERGLEQLDVFGVTSLNRLDFAEKSLTELEVEDLIDEPLE